MTVQSFASERLDVYRLSNADVARSFEAVRALEGLHRDARDPWLRAAQSIPRNIARDSALECDAIQDVVVRTKGIKVPEDAAMKGMLHRSVGMLTRMAIIFDGFAESYVQDDVEIDYDNEHRWAGHGHEHEHGHGHGHEHGYGYEQEQVHERPTTQETPEPRGPTERRWRTFLVGTLLTPAAR